MNNELSFTDSLGVIIDAIRERHPLVHCMTNHVTVNDCANMLLAIGASPAMIDSVDEAYDFAKIADAVYINLGTLYKEQELAIYAAAQGAKEAGRPIVIDPVACGSIPRRAAIVARLADIAPVAIIKGNMGEIMALAGRAGASDDSRGVDSKGEILGIEAAAHTVAGRFRCVVAATGKRDVIADQRRVVHLANGTEMLTRISGAGCMAGAICAATAAVSTGNLFDAAIAGVSVMSIAGEIAALRAPSGTDAPGSFHTALFDAAATLTGAALREHLRMEAAVC
jgi:hydroxyethylthiazole kinase